MWSGGSGQYPNFIMRSPLKAGVGPCASNSTVSGTLKRSKPGVRDPSSGRATLYLAPGLRFQRWLVELCAVGFPIVDDLNGIESEPDIRGDRAVSSSSKTPR